jgi:DNA-binding NarL/FixJ family response regulator
MITMILADDDPIIIAGLSMIIGAQDDFSLLGTARDGAEAVALCRKEKPDVAILDIRMPGTDGIEAAGIILEEGLSSPLLLTTFDEPELIQRALDVGAMGYILKNSPPDRITSAIKIVYNGGAVFSPDILTAFRVAARPAENGIWKYLTIREFEIVTLIAEGLSNQEIAEKLHIAGGTVRNYISVILEKTGLAHRTGVAVKYWRWAAEQPRV